MTERHTKLYIEDILTSIDSIEEYTSNISSWQEFRDHKMVFDAVIRNFEIIGEAVKNLVVTMKINEGKMPWPKIIGLRNKIAHEYFGIEAGIIWKTVQEDLPLLKQHIKELKND